MEWRGVTRRRGRFSDRPTDRSTGTTSGERARRKRRRRDEGETEQNRTEGFPGYFVSEVVLVSLLAVS